MSQYGGRITRWNSPETGANLVPNPTFVVDAAGKLTGWTFTHTASLSVSDVHPTGGRSILLKGANLTQYTDAAYCVIDLPAGRYSLRAMVKAVGVTAPAAGRVIMMSNVRIPNEQVALCTTTVGTAVTGTTIGWVPVYARMFAWAGGKVTLQCTGYGEPSGELYYANLELFKHADPPCDMFVLSPNYMGQLWSDGPQEIAAAVHGAPGTLEFVDTANATVASKQVAENGTVTLTLPALTDGVYTVRWRTAAAATYLPEARIVKTPRTAKIRVDPDNAWVQPDASGTPTRRFPIGVYDTSGYPGTVQGWTDYLSPVFGGVVNGTPRMKIDFYLNYWLGLAPLLAITNLGAALAKWGMSYFDTINNFWKVQADNTTPLTNPDGSIIPDDVRLLPRATALADKPGIAGWYTADERPASMATPTWEMKKIMREGAPGLPSFLVHFWWVESDFPLWDDVPEVHAVDPYPCRANNVNTDGSHKLEEIVDAVHTSRRALKGARPVWAVLQFWGGLDATNATTGVVTRPFWRMPSAKELRQMAWLAIAAGANGVWAWSLGARGLAWVPEPNRTQMREAWIALTEEIKSHESALLGAEVPAPTLPTGVIGIARKAGDKIHVFTANKTNAAITADGKTWAPYDSQLWTIDAPPPPPPPPPPPESTDVSVVGTGTDGKHYTITISRKD